MDNPAKFDEIEGRLDRAGLLSANKGEAMRVAYPPAGADDRWSYNRPARDDRPFDVETFGIKCGLASLAMRLVGMARQDLYGTRPQEAINIIEDAASRMADLAIRFKRT